MPRPHSSSKAIFDVSMCVTRFILPYFLSLFMYVVYLQSHHPLITIGTWDNSINNATISIVFQPMTVVSKHCHSGSTFDPLKLALVRWFNYVIMIFRCKNEAPPNARCNHTFDGLCCYRKCSLRNRSLTKIDYTNNDFGKPLVKPEQWQKQEV